MSLVIALIVLIISCIFYILFLRLWKLFTVIILNYFSGSFLIASLFIWSCEFLPCFFICPIFLCLFLFFLTYCIWSLLFPDLRDVSLLPLVFAVGGKGCFSGLCWFLVRGDMTLRCSGGGEFCFLFFLFLFPEGHGCVRWYILESIRILSADDCYCAFVLPVDWVSCPAVYMPSAAWWYQALCTILGLHGFSQQLISVGEGEWLGVL